MKKISIFALSLLTISQLSASNFNSAKEIGTQQVIEAQSELSVLEARIGEEKLPMAKLLNDLETEAVRLRASAEESRKLRDTRVSSLQDLEKDVSSWKDNNSYLANLMRDYVIRFKAQIHFGEVPIYDSILTEALNVNDNVDLTEKQKFGKQLNAIEASLKRTGAVLGGQIFEGNAIVKSNNNSNEKGVFAMVGPLVYFSSSETDYAGLALEVAGQSDAVLEDLGAASYTGIREMTQSGGGIVPVDTSLGEAIKYASVNETLYEEIFEKGGSVMYPIMLLALVSLILGIFKWFEISGVKKAKEEDLLRILALINENKRDEALAFANTISGPVGKLLVAAVQNCDTDKEVVEEVLYEVIINTQPKLERILPFISVTAATAPLLGLLGTVTGMIKTFKLITVVGTGDAGSLASGISEAMITTKWGLIIAIPALIVHAILSRMVKGVIGSMEQTAIGFINGIETSDSKNA
jgi:biopolymer transport protein ExbB